MAKRYIQKESRIYDTKTKKYMTIEKIVDRLNNYELNQIYMESDLKKYEESQWEKYVNHGW